MSELRPEGGNDIPSDFPNEPIFAVVGGAQPKLALCIGDDGAYRSPMRSAKERLKRYEIACEITGELVAYFGRKKAEFPLWTDDTHLERIRRGVVSKSKQGKWPFTEAEQRWIMSRLREQCCSSGWAESAAD